VYLKIASRSFRVIPQFEIAGYFIDLLVEGMKGRLAVECDGDEVHGADRFDADMARQRMLERCGLNFWRIRASTFYRDEDAAMEELWTILAQRLINPVSMDEAAPITQSQTQPHPVQSSQVSPVVVDPECGEEVEEEEAENPEQSGSDPAWFRSEQPTTQNSLYSSATQSRERESESLTSREQEILELIWAGFKSKEIGQRLKISVKTVEAHRASIMKKKRVSNTAQLLKVAIQDGTLKIR
jgi:DNA-binding CsgD family transcriptional regulator/very-short-patch-repair endonuclease